jgi:hypothetical protein
MEKLSSTRGAIAFAATYKKETLIRMLRLSLGAPFASSLFSQSPLISTPVQSTLATRFYNQFWMMTFGFTYQEVFVKAKVLTLA